MKPQFQHEANTSFALWLDHYLVCGAEAFSNKQGQLYYTPDERIPIYPEDQDGFISYNSEYKQWVYDSDASNADIPDGVFINTGDGAFNFCPRGQSGLSLDFENGRVLLSGSFFPDNYDSLEIECHFAVKDVNIYLADDTEENFSSKIKKFNLIGIPFQIIIGNKNEGNNFEFKEIGKDSRNLSIEEIAKIINQHKI